MASGFSILKPLGYQRSKECGYCKTKNGTCSYYLSCDNMCVDHYQELMDRGWRRSGTTYYKPDLLHSCCPHYTIRLEASNFKPKREQRSAVNKFNQYVTGPEYRGKKAMLAPVARDVKKKTRDKFVVTEAVHAAEYDRLPRPTGQRSHKPIEPAHKFEVNLEGDSCTEEKHDIMLKYQTQVHKDPASRWRQSSFKRFLCEGLDRKVLKIKGRTMRLGSYHQCYRLDGKLVAVGVLDLLPHVVSSVYLFYDPEYSEWDWGKISALQEIALTIEGGYQYYYMGYYIHTCQKMRYKGRYGPGSVLDPASLEWYPFDDDFRKQLDQRKYVSRSNDKYLTELEAMAVEITASPSRVEPVTKDQLGKKLTGTEELETDSDPSDAEDTDIPEGSLFDYHIPGVLTKEDVLKLDLDHWKLLVRAALIDLEDLRGWEDWQVDDPSTIKGICAELIAATGPALLRNAAVSLF